MSGKEEGKKKDGDADEAFTLFVRSVHMFLQAR